MIINRFLLFILILTIGCVSNNHTDNNKKVYPINDSIENISEKTIDNKKQKNTQIDSNDISEKRGQIIKPSIVLPGVKNPDADTIFPDTIEIRNYRLIINQIDKDKFLKITSEQNIKRYPSSGLSKIIENYNEKAWRQNDSTIMIELNSGIIDTISNFYSDGLESSMYYYIDYLEEIKSHLLVGQYYESDNYVLVNDSTGEIEGGLLSSNVSIDSTRQRLISYAWDGFTYESGGFKIYDISKGQMDLIIDYHQNNPYKDGFFWSLSDVHYLSPNELIYIHQIYPTSSSSVKRKKFYARLMIEKTTSN